MIPVWLFVVTPRPGSDPLVRWCVLRHAIPGGRITTLCATGDGFTAAQSYGPATISTQHPRELACPACERHLGVTAVGAAVAVEPEREEDLAIARETTADLRGPAMLAVEAVGDWT